MFDGILHTVGREFALNAALTAAETSSLRVAALKNKVFNIAMECKSVVKAFVAKVNKILNRQRSLIAVKLNLYRAVVFDYHFRMMSAFHALGAAGSEA